MSAWGILLKNGFTEKYRIFNILIFWYFEKHFECLAVTPQKYLLQSPDVILKSKNKAYFYSNTDLNRIEIHKIYKPISL